MTAPIIILPASSHHQTASIEHLGELRSSFWKSELKPTPAERVVISRDIKDAHVILSPEVDLVVVRDFWSVDVDAAAQEFLTKNPFIDWHGSKHGTDLSALRTHVAKELQGLGDNALRDGFADGVMRFGAVLTSLLGSLEIIGISAEFQQNPADDSDALQPHVDPHALNATCAPLNVGTIFPVMSSSGENYLLQALQGDLTIFKGNICHPRTKAILNPGQGVVHFAPPVEECRWVVIGTSSLGSTPQSMTNAFRTADL